MGDRDAAARPEGDPLIHAERSFVWRKVGRGLELVRLPMGFTRGGDAMLKPHAWAAYALGVNLLWWLWR